MTESDALISQRAAARLLKEGVGLSRRHADRVLATGLAGNPLRVGGALLYELDRVRQLAATPHVDAGYVDAACPGGYFVSRRPIGRELGTISEGWDVAWIGTVWMQMHVDRFGSLPFLSTVAGFVTHGADIKEVDFTEDGRARFELAPPGEWFGELEGRRFVTGVGRDNIVRLPGRTPAPLKYAAAAPCARMRP